MSGAASGHDSTVRRRLALPSIAVGITVLALIAGLLVVGPPIASPSPAASDGTGATAEPGSSPAAGATAEPGSEPGTGAWVAAELAPFSPPAALEADRRDAAGVASDSAFTLTSAEGADPQALAAGLAFAPAVEFTVAPAGSSAAVRIIPRAALEEGRVYRAELRTPGGAVEGTWAFQVRGPIHAVQTIPGNRTTGVPLDAGIEITFDQDGVEGIGPGFSISPAATGRFERSGRTQVFIPDALAPGTVYTVTVRKGLGRTGSDVQLEQDVAFQFETVASKQPPGKGWSVSVDRVVIEASPNERPVIGVMVEEQDDDCTPSEGSEECVERPSSLPATLPISVYRYASRDAAAKALVEYLSGPSWATASRPRLDPAGLRLVVETSPRLQSLAQLEDGRMVVRLPGRLPRGWYLVDVGPDSDAQAILQVTEVSAWVSVLTDRTVVWANDTVTGRPLDAAKVSVLGGPFVGSTTAKGLMVAPTPRELVPAATEEKDGAVAAPPPIMLVRARSGASVLVPFEISASTDIYRGEWWKDEPLADESWWSLLATDRTLYRPTDKVNAWGLLQRRIDRSVPSSIHLRIVRTEGDAPAVAEAKVAPGAAGAFSATLALVDAVDGSYYLEALVDGRAVARAWLTVGDITKPIYRLAASTDRRVVASGDPVSVTTEASFIDGQPVPGLNLQGNCARVDEEERCDTLTTNGGGVVIVTWKPGADETWEGPNSMTWDVRAGTEEASINASADVLVFPSSYTFDAEATLAGKRVVVAGTLREVDFPRIERELSLGTYEGRDGGTAVPGRSLTARITELIPTKRLVRRVYDYVEKRVVPLYEYGTKRNFLGERSIVTRADGSFSTRIGVPSAGHGYEIVLTTTDPKGRAQRQTLMASPPDTSSAARATPEDPVEGPSFERVSANGYSVGDTVRMAIVSGRTVEPTGGRNRYLYIVAQRGLRDAFVSSSPRFVRTFGEADVPRIFVVGVRFTGSTYAPKAATWLDFDTRDRQLSVQLSADAAGYRPGDRVTLAARITDPKGKPVPATVVLRAVDEKLFAMGAAGTVDPMGALYGGVTSGVLRFSATHQVPVMNPGEGEGGDATGGDIRDDFRDSVLFRTIQTDAAGVGRLTFDLSDDLTSWHISATALTGDLMAGEGQLLVPASLPFFVDVALASSYLAGDRPTLAVRAYGSGLAAGDPVTITVSAPTLGVTDLEARGVAFTPIAVPLPALTVGTHEITINGRADGHSDLSGALLADAIRRPIEVVTTRVVRQQSAVQELAAGTGLPGGSGMTTYTFTDSGRGAYVDLLGSLAMSDGTRADRAVAQQAARALLTGTFGWSKDVLPPAADAGRFPVTVPSGENGDDDGAPATTTAGLALVPWGGPSPVLASRVALAAPNVLPVEDLAGALQYTKASAATSRETRILAIAGLAALGRPVGDDIASIKSLGDLTPRERLYAALAAEAFGDPAWAIDLVRGLLREHGETRGPWTRLRIGTTPDEISVDTAMLSTVAAGVGDPVAGALFTYVAENPPTTDLVVLEQIGYLRRMIPRTPAAPASFAWTVDGDRHVVNLGAGEGATLILTAEQRGAVRLEPLSGRLRVVATWLAPMTVTTPAPSADVAIDRTVTPSGEIPAAAIVEVLLSARLASSVQECWEIADYVPSGLVPLDPSTEWVGDTRNADDHWPDEVDGQRVVFGECSGTDPATRLRYRARVVTAGQYAWEPAVIQRSSDLQIVAIAPATTTTIGSP